MGRDGVGTPDAEAKEHAAAASPCDTHLPKIRPERLDAWVQKRGLVARTRAINPATLRPVRRAERSLFAVAVA